MRCLRVAFAQVDHARFYVRATVGADDLADERVAHHVPSSSSSTIAMSSMPANKRGTSSNPDRDAARQIDLRDVAADDHARVRPEPGQETSSNCSRVAFLGFRRG